MLASSTDAGLAGAAVAELGRCLTGSEARGVADRIDVGESLTTALKAVDQVHRHMVRELIVRAGLASPLSRLGLVCRAIEGARSTATRIDPLWTMPGDLAQTGPLTSSVPDLVKSARTSITCSTYNFQKSSALWTALHDAAQQPQVTLRVYVDAAAAQPTGTWKPPSLLELVAHLHPGRVYCTREVDGSPVRNHAKFIVVDHRFVLVTSANFSHSAEYRNVELGVRIDSRNLAESIEREIRGVEPTLFRRLKMMQTTAPSKGQTS